MPLHPQVRDLLKQIADSGARPYHQVSVDEARRTFATRALLPPSQVAVAKVENRNIPGPGGEISVRIYTPPGSGPFPLLVYFHGGGWVVGNLDSHDSVCRELCGRAELVVVSVDYRLAPEHRFPAAVDDCIAATRWAANHAASLDADPTRVVVGGDSAGGNLAAAVALQLRDDGGPPLAAQLLVYPAVRMDGTVTPSMIENAVGYGLQRADMDWFCAHYLPSPDAGRNFLASPLLATSLANLPPALVQTCEFDPLRDEGEAYAHALRAAGVDVTATRFEGSIHAAWGLFTVLEPGRRMIDQAVDWLRARLRSRPAPAR
ncbi:MAG: alpha/beta hydrolase [Panacagrimonas sp.]